MIDLLDQRVHEGARACVKHRASRLGVIDACDAITHANCTVGFRNRLTHEYAKVDDALVRGVIERDLAGLRSETASLLGHLDDAPTDIGD